jgi:ArsR family transcriptional regulator
MPAGRRKRDEGAPRWELYRLLADPTRLKLLALAQHEELAVSEMAELLRSGEPKISRHAAALRDAGLLVGRKQGTWLLLRVAPHAAEQDAVIADAIAAGTRLCGADGTLERVPEVIAARDVATREFFARGGTAPRSGPPEELGAYLRALGTLVWPRRLCIDAGTGDGALLEVLAPVFEQVIALDRSDAQLDLARERATKRQLRNVRFVRGEIDGPEVKRATHGKNGRGADALFAARVLHHAPVPARALGALVSLVRPAQNGTPGGAVIIIDYEAHRDEALRQRQADLWLGFETDELVSMAEHAGLTDIEHGRIPRAWRGAGPDSDVNWQWLAGRRGQSIERKKS